MKKTTALLIVMLISVVTVFVYAQNQKSTKSVWSYEVPEAPYGYEKGNLVLTRYGRVVTGEVEVNSGYKIKMKDVTLEKDTLKGEVYIENELVDLKAIVKDSIIVGTVNTSMGVMSFKAKKNK